MAGHSHWAQVKHKKALLDKKRSQLMGKLINAILVSARVDPNPETNPKLRNAIEKAKEFGVPQETIERNLKKAQGLLDKTVIEEIILEAYAPNGVALLIKCATDNKNRTIGEVKRILNKYEGKLAEPGSVMWLFEEKGVLVINKADFKEEIIDKLSEYLQDFETKDDNVILYTSVENLFKTKTILEKENIQVLSTEIQFVPKNYVNIKDKEIEDKVNKLIEELLENNDVYEVYTNTK
ncbi:MAG: YebC/PmpR family DNA-binding transcriptional regulator [Minisyncoccia bacterium]|jgi:YebC/PmpR family DNA-binding regulatory protein